MNMMTRIGRGSDAVIDALRAEFGAVLAERIIEAEALEFLWEARVRERYLGQQIGSIFDDEDGSEELSRVAILSMLDARWYVAMCLVDGDGAAVELLWKRQFPSFEEAEIALDRAR
ncbi:MAG: hypothetical protein ACK4SZ_16630 [Allosphingosinicella sp.]|uniref:hypothetical protein n=1 Tax=Allosphingosinicella sp. TaxID=2823234 RepID=UPI00392784B7